MKINHFIPVNILKSISAVRKAEVSDVDFSQESPLDINEILQWEKNEKIIKEQQKWDLNKIPLKFYIQRHNSEKLMPDFVKTIENSFQVWSRATLGLIRFEKSMMADGADITVKWTNETLAGRTYEAGHNKLKTVNNKIYKSEITLIVFPVIDINLTPEQRIDRLRRTSLHEIGHALGLEHSNNQKDIMFHRGIYNKNLSPVDTKRINELYKTRDLDVVS